MKNSIQTLTAHDFPIIILCGGKSSRMGEDKTFLPFGGNNSLISFQYNRLNKFFNNVFISSKICKFDFLEEKNPKIILDNNEVYSPLIALKSILTQVNAPKVFILTVDTPFVTIQTIEKLISMSSTYDITIASTPNKTHNLCGVFSASILQTIEDMLN